MASRIFTDKELLSKVNALIHPIVEEDFELWCEDKRCKGARYIINEAALLVENGSYKRYDYVIVVSAPYEERILRTMMRDGMSREQVMERINNQMSDEAKERVADEVIYTDDRHFIIPQILKIDKTLRSK